MPKPPRVALPSLVLSACLFAGGCDRAAPTASTAPNPVPAPRTPIATGSVVSVKVWDKPLTESTNSVVTFGQGSRVAVYDDFILVTDPDGVAHFCPKGYYSELSFKPDPR